MAGSTTIDHLHSLFLAGLLAEARAGSRALLEREPENAEALHVLGLISYRDGRFTDAIAFLRQSLTINEQAASWSNLGAALRADGRSADAESAYRKALSMEPGLEGALRNLGNLLLAADRVAEAEAVLTDALQHYPQLVDLRRRLAGILQKLARHGAAAECWRLVVAEEPDDGDAALNLARCLYASGDCVGSEAVLRHRIAQQGDDAAALICLGVVLGIQGQLEEAEQAFVRGLAIAPAVATAWVSRSDVLRRLGRLEAAEMAARQALTIDPGLAEAAVNLGNALDGQHRHTEAEAAFDLALSLRPDCAEAFNGRGIVRLRRGAPVSAEADFRNLLRLRPDLPIVSSNLGISLLDQGQPVAAREAMRQACAQCPDITAAWRNLLFCLNYQPDLSAEEIFAEYRSWGEKQPPPSGLRARAIEVADRRLRIGYVSPDFRAQSARFFIKPLLAAHDRKKVEVYCYAELPHSDAMTGELQALADHWRLTVELNDEKLAQLIRSDQIDVLVDMGGYSTHSRITVFARKPAPVQIEYLLGHGATSGLLTMDGFLADARLVPTHYDHLFTERVLRLERIPLAYEAPPTLPAVGPQPAQNRGYITFGHFGRTARIHDGVVAAWARILCGVPGSRLVLNSLPYSEAALSKLFLDRFARRGIESHRIELICTQPQERTFLAYNDIDIALDPFPHNAGTTTIEALWMGVPVVSLMGRPPVGRFGASILHAVGLDEWSKPDLDAYVACATEAASDLGRLARLRASLRDRCLASPLNDATGLAREIEAICRHLSDASR
jgi:predicted O-linked N-acetylglucosamine transferase (SPINDLY family)